MKRTILFFLAALTLLALLPLLPSRPDPAAEVLRLHILANSDREEDQAVKLRVRDALLPLFEAAASYDDARSFVLDHGAALLDRCQTVLADAGVPYGAQLLVAANIAGVARVSLIPFLMYPFILTVFVVISILMS